MRQSFDRRTGSTLLSQAWLILLLPVVSSLVLPLFGCARRPRAQSVSSRSSEQVAHKEANDQQPPDLTQAKSQAAPERININTASVAELEQLPGIGKGFAARIIEHREKYGPFRRPEHLIMVRGISDRRFRALQDLITVE